MFTVIDNWQSGSLPTFTYWKNAWKTPTVSCPARSIPPAITEMVTSERRTRRRTAGAVALARKSAEALVRASSSAEARISAALSRSRPKALMTARPL